MEHQVRLRRNITLLRIIRALDMAMLAIPIIVIYYQSHGMSMQDVMTLQAIFGAAMLVVEIPSGYFSDVIGRRRTMIIGAALHTVGWILYAMADGFSDFLVAELILGFGAAFISGTDSAMLYDTLIDLGEEHSGVYQEGRMLAMANFSEAGAAIVGGMLAAISLHMPFYAQVAIMIPIVPLAMMLVEPSPHRRDGRKGSMRELLDVVVNVVHHNKQLRAMLGTASLLGASTLTVLWMYQPYWKLMGVPVGWFGAIWAGGNVLVGIMSMHSARLSRRFGDIRIVGWLIFLLSVSCIVIGLNPVFWVLPLFAVFYATRGLANP
ncbi:MAG: MFS transporter, partial [Ignavibacteriae bacterium]